MKLWIAREEHATLILRSYYREGVGV